MTEVPVAVHKNTHWFQIEINSIINMLYVPSAAGNEDVFSSRFTRCHPAESKQRFLYNKCENSRARGEGGREFGVLEIAFWRGRLKWIDIWGVLTLRIDHTHNAWREPRNGCYSNKEKKIFTGLITPLLFCSVIGRFKRTGLWRQSALAASRCCPKQRYLSRLFSPQATSQEGAKWGWVTVTLTFVNVFD